MTNSMFPNGARENGTILIKYRGGFESFVRFEDFKVDFSVSSLEQEKKIR